MLEDTFHGFLEIDKIGKTDESTKSYFLSFLWIFLDRIIVTAPSIPHFKGLGTRNLLYELSIYEKINNKATMIMLSYFDFCWLTRYCNSGPPREVRQARCLDFEKYTWCWQYRHACDVVNTVLVLSAKNILWLALVIGTLVHCCVNWL